VIGVDAWVFGFVVWVGHGYIDTLWLYH
jgi:hypothetical protein